MFLKSQRTNTLRRISKYYFFFLSFTYNLNVLLDSGKLKSHLMSESLQNEDKMSEWFPFPQTRDQPRTITLGPVAGQPISNRAFTANMQERSRKFSYAQKIVVYWRAYLYISIYCNYNTFVLIFKNKLGKRCYKSLAL